MDSDPLIQSARGVKAHGTARPVGNPLQCMLGRETETQRCPQKGEHGSLPKATQC